MRTPKNNGEPRKICGQPFMVIAAALLVLFMNDTGISIFSVRQAVAAEIIRGEPIAPATTGSSTSDVPIVSASKLPTANAIGQNKTVSPSNLVVQPLSQQLVDAGGTEQYTKVAFSQLSGFQFRVTEDLANPPVDKAEANQKVREQIPNGVWKLNEKNIALTGFMLPVHLKDGLVTDFILLPNRLSCCYGIKPRINEWVVVNTTGKGVKSVMDTLVTAQGTLHVGAQRENGTLLGIYQLDLDQLKIPTN